MLQNNIELTNKSKKNPPLLVSKHETSKYHMISFRIQTFLPLVKKSKLSPSDKNNALTSDQASELSTLDTNIDKFQSMMENNNSNLKSEVLNRSKAKLHDNLTSNNSSFSLKIYVLILTKNSCSFISI